MRRRVNALSGLYLISTYRRTSKKYNETIVSMPSRAYTSFLPGMSGRVDVFINFCVNALSGLYLISTVSQAFPDWEGYKLVSMPSRAYTSFLRYPFKNLGFMRFSEPAFAGIYQNILTTAVFRAC